MSGCRVDSVLMMDCCDSDDSELMPKVFAVDDVVDDVDFSVPPTSGQEYLRRVMLEAKNCPVVVAASVCADSNFRNVSIIPPCRSLHPAPHGYAPSLAWQKRQEADFSQMRQRLWRHKALLKNSGKTKCTVPAKEDVSGWCRLCFGQLDISRPRDELRGCNGTDELTCSDSDASDGRHVSCRGGTPPLLSIVTYIDQPTVMKVLEYHINWMEKTGFTLEQGRWFYALLACLEKPLEPEACALIRNLARQCSTLRATLNERDECLTAINLLICLVAHYFGQSDLCDAS